MYKCTRCVVHTFECQFINNYLMLLHCIFMFIYSALKTLSYAKQRISKVFKLLTLHPPLNKRSD